MEEQTPAGQTPAAGTLVPVMIGGAVVVGLLIILAIMFYTMWKGCSFGGVSFGTFVRDWADTLKYDSGQVRYRPIRKEVDEDEELKIMNNKRMKDQQRIAEARKKYEASPQYKEDQARISAFRETQTASRADARGEAVNNLNQFGSNYQLQNSKNSIAGAPRRYQDMTDHQSFGDASDLMPNGSFPGRTALDAHLSKYGERSALHITNNSATSLKGLRPDPPVDMSKEWGILSSAQRQNIKEGLETQGVKSGFTMGTEWDFDAFNRKNQLYS